MVSAGSQTYISPHALTPLFSCFEVSYGERPSKRLPTSKRRDHDEHWFRPNPVPSKIGGDIQINRLGFWRDEDHRARASGGEPADRPEALRNVEAATRAGRLTSSIHQTPTAPDVFGRTDFAKALHPYRGMPHCHQRGGLTRTGPERVDFPWDGRNISFRRPTRAAVVLASNRIGLWQLHRIDPKVPRE